MGSPSRLLIIFLIIFHFYQRYSQSILRRNCRWERRKIKVSLLPRQVYGKKVGRRKAKNVEIRFLQAIKRVPSFWVPLRSQSNESHKDGSKSSRSMDHRRMRKWGCGFDLSSWQRDYELLQQKKNALSYQWRAGDSSEKILRLKQDIRKVLKPWIFVVASTRPFIFLADVQDFLQTLFPLFAGLQKPMTVLFMLVVSC